MPFKVFWGNVNKHQMPFRSLQPGHALTNRTRPPALLLQITTVPPVPLSATRTRRARRCAPNRSGARRKCACFRRLHRRACLLLPLRLHLRLRLGDGLRLRRSLHGRLLGSHRRPESRTEERRDGLSHKRLPGVHRSSRQNELWWIRMLAADDYVGRTERVVPGLRWTAFRVPCPKFSPPWPLRLSCDVPEVSRAWCPK